MSVIKKYKSDIILIAVLLIVCAFFFIFNHFTSTRGKYVVVRCNGEVKQTFPLDTDIEFEIKGDNGELNVLKIENGCAKIENASCPDKLCVNRGKIEYVGESVICLPNKVVIEIISDDNNCSVVDVNAG